MSDLYNRIHGLCDSRGITIGKMCNDLSISRGNLTELKMGRIKSLKADTLAKIANYFGVSVDYLLLDQGTHDILMAAARQTVVDITDDQLKFALWGDTSSITDADLEDVRRFAAFIKQKREQEGGK